MNRRFLDCCWVRNVEEGSACLSDSPLLPVLGQYARRSVLVGWLLTLKILKVAECRNDTTMCAAKSCLFSWPKKVRWLSSGEEGKAPLRYGRFYHLLCMQDVMLVSAGNLLSTLFDYRMARRTEERRVAPKGGGSGRSGSWTHPKNPGWRRFAMTY